MGYINKILVAVFCATSAFLPAQEPNLKMATPVSEVQLGKEMVSFVRKGYEKGDYKQFLKEMDASFQKANLENLTQARKNPVSLQFQEQLEDELITLQNQKNEDLLNALSDKDHSSFAQKVRSLASKVSTPEQQKAISRLNSLIALAPNKGANGDENALINIDIEYEYKLSQEQLLSKDVSSQEKHYRQIALRMEKMEKMVKAAKQFKDLSLKKAVELASANLDARLARNIDGAELNALVKAKKKPTNKTEERIYSILSSYQGQFKDLLKNLR